jgi:nitroreductase
MDLSEVIKKRRNVERFEPTPLPEDSLRKALNLARLAPSANNNQPFRYVVVRDEEIKRKLMSMCKNDKAVAEAPAVVAFLGVVDDAYPVLGYYMSSFSVDVAMSLAYFLLAAEGMGLGTRLVFNFHDEKAKEILGIPPDLRIVALVPVGTPAKMMEDSGLKNLSELVSYNEYE